VEGSGRYLLQGTVLWYR